MSVDSFDCHDYGVRNATIITWEEAGMLLTLYSA